MQKSGYKDSEGYSFHFHDNCRTSDREYFMKCYPRVEDIVKLELNCTSCNDKVVTATTIENVYTHPKLGVTQCEKCHDFYHVSWRISKDLSYQHLFIFRTLANSQRMSMATTISVSGVGKAELFVAAAFAKSHFAKFALSVISQKQSSQLSLRPMNGNVLLVIKMPCCVCVLNIGLCSITLRKRNRKSALEL